MPPLLSDDMRMANYEQLRGGNKHPGPRWDVVIVGLQLKDLQIFGKEWLSDCVFIHPS